MEKKRADAGRGSRTCLVRPNSLALTGTGNIYFPCSADHYYIRISNLVRLLPHLPNAMTMPHINTHTHESNSGDWNRDENEDEDRIVEGGRGAKKCKKPHRSCRRQVGNGGDLGGKRKKRRQERVGSVAASPDNLESRKEAGRGAQGTQGSSKSCISRETVSPLSRMIRGFRNKYH